MCRLCFLTFIALLFHIVLDGQDNTVYPGADEKTPSRAQYFSWINNCNEGTTEKQTMINLDFFQWLKDEYGMQLDIYAFDAGAIDGKRFYGSVQSDRFKKQFPNHFDKIYSKTKDMGVRLGIWGGPDGFGDTPQEEADRIEQMVSLARDYDFELFKFDGVCGQLREEKQNAFIEMMSQVRKYSPDLILLNHRLNLGKGLPHATTFLWEGNETYIDVHMANTVTAPHHRAAALDRGHTPDNKRLTEDHGVCLSSCLDRWDDELILQAFNRNLILAPQIYANPWFLKDREFAKLANIYNLHRKYRDILVDGKPLPEGYGPNAMSRGNGEQRLLTLTNLSWETKLIQVRLDEEIGLNDIGTVQVRSYHPSESILGNYAHGQVIELEVLPFRSALFYIGKAFEEDVHIVGIDYQTIKENNQEKEIKILCNPAGSNRADIKINIDHEEVSVDGKIKHRRKYNGINFPLSYKINKTPYHDSLGPFQVSSLISDADALYEATVFAADNNALEVRSIERSGWSDIPQVRAAQEAFFEQKTFTEKGIWDKNLFDKDTLTGFAINRKWNVEQRVNGGCLRINLGEIVELDQLIIKLANEYDMQPQLISEGNWIETSVDLINWTRETYITELTSKINLSKPVRYIRIPYAPQRIVEITGTKNGEEVSTEKWQASNLFAHANTMVPHKIWKKQIKLKNVHVRSYLCIALEGKHGVEGAYVAAKIDGKYLGCPDRAVSYPSNTWEYVNAKRDANYTYYLPITNFMLKKKIELYVMGYDEENLDFKPKLYITTSEIPYEEKTLIIKK